MQQITNNSVTNNPSTGDQEVLVRVEGVSKKFCRSLKKSLWYGVCDIGAELNPFRHRVAGLSVNGERLLDETDSEPQITSNTPGHPPGGITNNSSALRPDEFYAVRDVSFELRRGECLGLIGHNGAGKTTLLKMLNGLIKPDSGKITMRGRVGALIALGAGFNPILTGRENIYINGSVLGLSKKEIDAKIDEIIDFAEIGEFIDSPVQNYSSGMSVRLGFAVASSLNPDVLILDEVLAVGDIGFVVKCLNRVRRLSARAAVILVSHNMQSVSSFCSRVIYMEHGRSEIDTDETSRAIDKYFEMITSERNETGSGEACISAISLKEGSNVRQGGGGHLQLSVDIAPSCPRSNIHVYISDESMTPLVCFPIMDKSGKLRVFQPGFQSIEVPLGQIDLTAGKYSFTVTISTADSKRVLLRAQGLSEFRVSADVANWGKVVRPVVATTRGENR
jgi:lipopolysaccharide transport system ATP-binding protein